MNEQSQNVQQPDDVFEKHDGVEFTDEARESSLDRQITLPRASASTVTAVLTVALAALVRLPGLDRWAVTPDEARIALAARGLVTGNGPFDDLAAHPTVVDLVSIGMFLGHTTESIGRVVIALTGVGAVLMALLLHRWIGAVPAISAAILIAASPTLIAASRSMDGGAVAVVLLLGLLVAGLSVNEATSDYGSALTGALLGALLMTGPLGPVAALFGIAIVFAVAAPGWRLRGRATVLGLLGGFGAAIVIIGTALLTRPGELVSSLQAIFSTLWHDHLTSVGEDVHLPLWNLLLNEPLILALAIFAGLLKTNDFLLRLLRYWAVAAFVLLSLFNVTEPAGYALIVLPLALLAGFGAAGIVEAIPRAASLRWPAAGFVASIVLLVFAFVSVMLLAIDGRSSTAASIAEFLLLLAVAVVPLAFAISFLGNRLEGYRLHLVGLAAVVLLGGFTVRSAALTASDRQGEPGEVLYASTMSPGLPTLVNTIHKLSRDLTRTERSAQMPVGGVGLRIVIDETLEEPFAWYFRDYPNLSFIDPETETLPPDTQLAVLREGVDTDGLNTSLRGQTYLYQYEAAPAYSDPDYSSIVGDVFSLSGWQRLVDFLINRELDSELEPVHMRVLATPQIADRMFADTGPYNLSERAGPGRAAGQFIQPRGIAIDGDGHIYVVDAGNGRIQRFGPDGTHELSFGEPGAGPGQLGPFENGPGGAGGIAIGRDGNLYVADTWNHRIAVFSPDGEFATSWGAFFDGGDQLEDPTAQGGQFYGPRDIAADGAGLLYVSDTGNERVQVFTEEGEFVTAFGSTGSGPGELLEPVGVAIGPAGEILVADSHNARIARFDPDGTPLDPWPVEAWAEQRFFEPYLAVTTSGLTAASSSGTGDVSLFDSNGTLLERLVAPGMQQPYGLAVTPAGSSLLVSDGQSGIIIELALPADE